MDANDSFSKMIGLQSHDKLVGRSIYHLDKSVNIEDYNDIKEGLYRMKDGAVMGFEREFEQPGAHAASATR